MGMLHLCLVMPACAPVLLVIVCWLGDTVSPNRQWEERYIYVTVWAMKSWNHKEWFLHRWPKCTSHEVPPRKNLRLLSIAYPPTVTHTALPKVEGEKGYNRLDGVPWPSKLGKLPFSVGLYEIFLSQSSHSWIIGESAGGKLSSTYLSKQWTLFWAHAQNNFCMYLLCKLESCAGSTCIFNSANHKAESCKQWHCRAGVIWVIKTPQVAHSRGTSNSLQNSKPTGLFPTSQFQERKPPS